jgi:hypothetical protein
MPDWGELQTYARHNLKLLLDEPSAMVLGWQQQREDGELTRQAVYVFAKTAYGEPWVVLLAPVCPEELISSRAALLLSSELTIGALVVRNADYALRVTLSTQSLPLPDIVLCMERLAWAAVALREHFMEGKPLLAGQPSDNSLTDPPFLHKVWAD